MDFVSWLVKNERALDGYLKLGAIRTATFNAWPDTKMNDRPALISKESAHHDRRQNVVVLTLLSSHETLQNSGNPLVIY